jgi:hypothetical protein
MTYGIDLARLRGAEPHARHSIERDNAAQMPALVRRCAWTTALAKLVEVIVLKQGGIASSAQMRGTLMPARPAAEEYWEGPGGQRPHEPLGIV